MLKCLTFLGAWCVANLSNPVIAEHFSRNFLGTWCEPSGTNVETKYECDGYQMEVSKHRGGVQVSGGTGDNWCTWTEPRSIFHSTARVRGSNNAGGVVTIVVKSDCEKADSPTSSLTTLAVVTPVNGDRGETLVISSANDMYSGAYRRVDSKPKATEKPAGRLSPSAGEVKLVIPTRYGKVDVVADPNDCCTGKIRYRTQEIAIGSAGELYASLAGIYHVKEGDIIVISSPAGTRGMPDMYYLLLVNQAHMVALSSQDDFQTSDGTFRAVQRGNEIEFDLGYEQKRRKRALYKDGTVRVMTVSISDGNIAKG
jgi:hypothetical protein